MTTKAGKVFCKFSHLSWFPTVADGIRWAGCKESQWLGLWTSHYIQIDLITKLWIAEAGGWRLGGVMLPHALSVFSLQHPGSICCFPVWLCSVYTRVSPCCQQYQDCITIGVQSLIWQFWEILFRTDGSECSLVFVSPLCQVLIGPTWVAWCL